MPNKRELSGDAYAFEAITVADTAIGFTAETFGSNTVPHKRAVCTVTGGIIRYRYDGTNPTAAVGHMKGHGDEFIIEGGVNLVNFKAIRAGTESGVLSVTYEAVHA